MSAGQKAVLPTFPGFIMTLPTLLLMVKCSVFNTVLFLRIFFLTWTILKVFIEFVTILLLLFMFCFFGIQACRLLAP